MTPLNLDEVVAYIHANIGPQFHAKKTAKIKSLRLDDVIKRKNPYLFRAKGSNSAHDFIKAVLDATVSSGEETTFGNFLENVAIFVCEKVYGGRKSGIRGLDLEFEDGDKKYLISIKSGPNWGNAGQIRNMINSFTAEKSRRSPDPSFCLRVRVSARRPSTASRPSHSRGSRSFPDTSRP